MITEGYKKASMVDKTGNTTHRMQPWLLLVVLASLSAPCRCTLNLTAAAAQVRLLQKETKPNSGFFFTNIGPNSFEYRGMFAPGQTPPDFHKNFKDIFDKFAEFPNFNFPKPTPSPTPAPVYNPPAPVYNPPAPVYNPPIQAYVPVQPAYVPPTRAPTRRPATTRAPQVIPKYELYRIRPTQAPNLVPVQPVVNQVQPIINPVVNQLPVQPFINPVQPVVHQHLQPLVNPVQHQYRYPIPTIAPRIAHNQQLINHNDQPYINPLNQVNPVQLVQPRYHISVPTIAPRIEHNDDQPYVNPEQQPFQFPVNFPEYHLVRGVTRAESYPKIFRFTDGRINIVDFERKKKKNQGKRQRYNDGLDPDLVPRERFLILHGGYYPGPQNSDDNTKYNNKFSNQVYYDNINDVQDLQKLEPNLGYYYQK